MKLLTLPDVAQLLGVSYSTIHKIHSELPGATKINKRVLYREEAILDFCRAGGSAGKRSVPITP
jgi:predicted DNA-binding transcriptional regulator AlpA